MQRKPSTKQANDTINRSATKKGPGRRHADGHKHFKAPTKEVAPIGRYDFTGQHTNPARNAERGLIAAIGRRQEKRLRMSEQGTRKAA